MTTPAITVTDTPEAALKGVIEAGLAQYNESQAKRRDYRPLAVVVSDPATGAPVGGIYGRTSLGLFYLELFYLPEALRGHGLGSRLLKLAEAEAIRRGCRAATLVTVNFQAPGFYARHGWEEFGRIASAPGVERIFFRKNFVA